MPESALSQAIKAHRDGHLDDAEREYRAALHDNPVEPTALHLLGMLFLDTDRAQDALEVLSKAAEMNPQNAEVMYHFGMAAKALNQNNAALDYLHRALDLNPALHAAKLEIGHLHKQARNLADAKAAFLDLVAAIPNEPHGYVELGLLLRDAGNLTAALEHHKKALLVAPKTSVVHQNYGETLVDMGNLEDGIAALEQAVVLDPANMEARVIHALAVRDCYGVEAGLRAIEQAIAEKPDEVWTHVTKAELLFEAGQFPNAWQAYKWRTKVVPSLNRPRLGAVAWDGTSLANRDVLLRAEQGVGEQVMFASMIPDLLSEAASVVLECEPRLNSLFVRSFPEITTINKKRDEHLPEPVPDPEVEVVLGDLGARFRRSVHDFPTHQGYLKADEKRVMRLRNTYLELAAGRPIVGVSWRSFNPLSAWRKSLPLLQWADILTRDDVFCIDIQYGDVDEERVAAVQQGYKLFRDSNINPSRSVDDAAAQIAALDAVISTSNSCVHIAGALNIPAFVLLPARIQRHWYWFPKQFPNPWYPSVQVLQQKKLMDWTGPLSEAGQALDGLVEGVS